MFIFGEIPFQFCKLLYYMLSDVVIYYMLSDVVLYYMLSDVVLYYMLSDVVLYYMLSDVDERCRHHYHTMHVVQRKYDFNIFNKILNLWLQNFWKFWINVKYHLWTMNARQMTTSWQLSVYKGLLFVCSTYLRYHMFMQ